MRVEELVKYLNTLPKDAFVTGFLPNYGDVGIEDIHDAELQLGDINIPFYCQSHIEENLLCEKQCKHCEEYYEPVESN